MQFNWNLLFYQFPAATHSSPQTLPQTIAEKRTTPRKKILVKSNGKSTNFPLSIFCTYFTPVENSISLSFLPSPALDLIVSLYVVIALPHGGINCLMRLLESSLQRFSSFCLIWQSFVINFNRTVANFSLFTKFWSKFSKLQS